ncbi:hypothetical protein AAVH_27135 [Aphelenchoides avenae]|nr:hypothetical protein AAVH_27135 [Aphelenchus avenae]
MALFGVPPNTGFGDETVEHDGEFTMPAPIDLVQARKDADVEASAFQACIDQLVSRCEEIMEIAHDPKVDQDADPRREIARLRVLRKICEEEISELGALVKDLRRTHDAYHQLVSELPKERRLRLDFTDEFNKVMQKTNYTESVKGTKKRVDELKATLKLVTANHDQLKQSLPENHVSFEVESESEYTGEDEPPSKASYEATSSRRTSKVPSLEKAKYLAGRVTFPGGKTLAEKKAEPAIVQAAAETFAERKARGQRIAAAIEEPKKTKPSGFSRREDSVVLDYPEFDDSYWDLENCPRPFDLAEPVNTSRWSIMLPNPKTTYFEPLQDCRDHDVYNDPHLRIEDAIPSFRIICKEEGGRRPAEASAIGRLHISGYGKMYLILWASRHHMKPRQDPANQPQRANLVVLQFINAVARHRSSELPGLLDVYYDRIREGFTDDPVSPYDFKTVIMRWYDSCPNAATFYDDHAAGPVYYNPPFLQGCRRDIADA